MPLPTPTLDDRRFQDLVDECKRRISAHCPEWTDHNVSDPGVTLIELFASMVEQVTYRLDRVPDRLYTRFLDLLGVRLYPPTAARAPLTFWLSSAQPTPIVVPEGTRVATPRVPGVEPVVFATVEELEITPVELVALRAAEADGAARALLPVLRRQGEAAVFSARPEDGDALLVGLSAAAPGLAVSLHLDCRVAGVGVDPDDPPLVWEAATADGWAPCEVDVDTTGGLNREGDVVLHVPLEHRPTTVAGTRGGWLRARLVPPRPDQAGYDESPVVRAASAVTLGGTVTGQHAERVPAEVVGTSDGTPAQRFRLLRGPVVPDQGGAVVEVGGADGWRPWVRVEDFAGSGPVDRHVQLDPSEGEVVFGPGLRDADGGFRQLGRVPDLGAPVRVRGYSVGGGAAGNVGSGSLVVLASSLPYVSRVENRRAAAGGKDGERLEEARVRGPVELRARGRAVTAEDFAALALAAAPEVARVHAVPASDDGGGVRVLVVPAVTAGPAGLLLEQLVPAAETLERVAVALRRRSLLGTRVVVTPARYQGVTVVARLRTASAGEAAALEARARQAVARWFDPAAGGPDGRGWPFGRSVHAGEVYGLLQQLPGVDLVEEVLLYPARADTRQRGKAAARIDLTDDALLLSVDPLVRVLAT